VAVPRLILIEGMIGSGKTTTAGHLADWLARRGEDVRAFGEGAADHPIRTRRVDELLAAPVPGDPEAYSAGQWRRLAERCLRDERTIILESIFLQNSVMPAFIDDAGTTAVTKICTEIQRSRRRPGCTTGTRSASSWCPTRSTTGRPPCGPSTPPSGPDRDSLGPWPRDVRPAARSGAFVLVEAVWTRWGESTLMTLRSCACWDRYRSSPRPDVPSTCPA